MKKQIAALATDENNIVMWDMDALLADYGEHPYVSVDTEKLVPQSWLSIDEEYALKTDVKLPLILFEIPHGLLYVADGNHRLYKATKEHIQKMNVRIIPEKIHLSYLFQCSVDVYYKVIEGLKNEGIFINRFLQP